MDKLILTQLTFSEIMDGLRSIVREEMRSEREQVHDKKFLSTKEVCNMFSPKISRPTLSRYVKKGLIPQQRMEGRVWYSYSEVVQAIEKIKKYQQ